MISSLTQPTSWVCPARLSFNSEDDIFIFGCLNQEKSSSKFVCMKTLDVRLSYTASVQSQGGGSKCVSRTAVRIRGKLSPINPHKLEMRMNHLASCSKRFPMQQHH